MRDPTVRAAAAAEKKRVRDAKDAARRDLWFVIRQLYIDDEKNPAEAAHCSMVGFFTRLLNDTTDTDLRKYASAPDARSKYLSVLEQSQPPKRPKPGRREFTLRDRWFADIMEDIRRRGFGVSHSKKKPEKGENVFSIMAEAAREIKNGVRESQVQEQMRATLLELRFTPFLADLRIQGLRASVRSYLSGRRGEALSEDSFERIWDKSEWAAKLRAVNAHAGKRRTSRR